jgi:hypothetical protein
MKRTLFTAVLFVSAVAAGAMAERGVFATAAAETFTSCPFAGCPDAALQCTCVGVGTSSVESAHAFRFPMEDALLQDFRYDHSWDFGFVTSRGR